jgi:hypothetical protein
MKEWSLTVRTVLAIAAYILSLILLINTSAFSFGDFKISFIMVNFITAIIIGVGFAVSRNVFEPTFFVCIGLCVPSLMAYSKLGKTIFEINVTNNFNAFFTAVFFVIIIVMLLAAGKLKKLENEYTSLVSNGAEEEDVKVVINNNLKVYFSFLGAVFGVTLVVIIFGFSILNVKGSIYAAIMTAILGVALFSGCVFYLSRKWSKKSGG